MRNKLVIFCGIILFFIFLSVSFSFPDLFNLNWTPVVATDNIYTWVWQKIDQCPWIGGSYPPLYFLSIGAYLKTLISIGILDKNLFFQNSCPIWDLILNRNFLFWAKLPYIIAHIASAYIFSLLFQKKRWWWFLFFLLNPVLIFVNYIEGQFEIITTFFILVSIYFIRKKNNLIAALSLGFGAAYKHIPFILVLPTILMTTKKLKKRILFLIVSLVPFVLFAVPVWGPDYLKWLAFSENTKMFEGGLDINGIRVSLYIMIYFLFLLHVFLEELPYLEKLYKYLFLFSILYFLTTSWFPQRIVFLIPTLLLVASYDKSIFKLVPIFSMAFLTYSFIMYYGLFDHTLLKPLISNVHGFNYDMYPMATLKSYCLSAMTGLLLYLTYRGAISKMDDDVEIRFRDIVLNFLPLIIYFGVLAGLLVVTGIS